MTVRRIAIGCLLVVAVSLAPATAASAAPDARVITITATSTWRFPSSDPSGIAWVPPLQRFIVVDGEVEETSHWLGRNAWWVRTDGRARRAWSTLPTTSEPTDVAARGSRSLLMTDDRTHRVFVWRRGLDRRFGTSDDVVRSFETSAFGAMDPEGIAYGAGAIYIANGEDSSTPAIYRITPGRDRRFDGLAPGGDDHVTAFASTPWGITDPEGVTYDRSTGTLLVISRSDDVIARVSRRGDLIDTYNLTSLGIRRAAGIALAPASDDPTITDVYVVDRGVDNNADPSENDGRLFELRLN
jgi:hypothetical protein